MTPSRLESVINSDRLYDLEFISSMVKVVEEELSRFRPFAPPSAQYDQYEKSMNGLRNELAY